MSYKLFLIELTVKTPLVIGSRFSKNWYTYTDPSIINARMIWGTILSRIADVKPELALEEHMNPRIAFSSLIYLENKLLDNRSIEYEPCIPSHPFNYKCKISNEIIYVSSNTLYRKIINDEILEMIREILSRTCRVEVDIGENTYIANIKRGLITPVKGLIKKENNKYTVCSRSKTISVEMVAIDKSSRSAKSEMLYTYEALPEGTKYYSLMIAPDNVLGEILDSLNARNNKEIILRMGRGVSKGYGVVGVKFYDKTSLLNEVDKYYAESLEDKILVLYSLSPVIWSNIVVNINSDLGIPVLPGLFIMRDKIYSTGTVTVRGWSRLYNTPTPTLKALAPGAIITYKVEDRNSLPSNIAELVLMMQRLGGPGLNFLIPLQILDKLFIKLFER